MPTLLRDLAEATRALRRSPSTALLMVAVLGLTIGATATLCTAVEAVILRPLPFPQAEQLVAASWPPLRFLPGMLFELSPTDRATLVTAAAILFTTAIATAWAPAHRAGRLDPITAFREE